MTGEKQVFLTKNESGGTVENQFRHWETVYCHFKVDPGRPEKTVKFQWINPAGQKELVYVHVVDKTRKDAYFTVSWLSLDVPLLGDLVGSKYLGKWRVIISLNEKQVAEESFEVY